MQSVALDDFDDPIAASRCGRRGTGVSGKDRDVISGAFAYPGFDPDLVEPVRLAPSPAGLLDFDDAPAKL